MLKLTAKLCLANSVKQLPPAQKMALLENEDGEMELLMVDNELNIFVANLKTFAIRSVTTASTLIKSLAL